MTVCRKILTGIHHDFIQSLLIRLTDTVNTAIRSDAVRSMNHNPVSHPVPHPVHLSDIHTLPIHKEKTLHMYARSYSLIH